MMDSINLKRKVYLEDVVVLSLITDSAFWYYIILFCIF